MSRLWLLLLALLLVLVVLPPAPGIAGKLAEDGRAGVVLDVQGRALVRPAGRDRWTPLGAKSVLYPGDLIRTRPRGAHALEFRLGGGSVLLGPGCEVAIEQAAALRVLRGELEVRAAPDDPVQVSGPGGFAQLVKGTLWIRSDGRTTTPLETAPRWIEGYRASASDEWMGSLLAQVDGRDVPLAVGYHKVDVEVRDQIARTTVEQSFVNATEERLEGVFYFPLPADASISGFGMWIGGELVEADIVERQRARQIYEDILRRKKDPGLLEWEGGNLFKARVFPIEPHSEKRIRIRYTQVLPLEADTWRYRYALRSELLQSHPLRELQIAVRVVSTQPMRAVGSPTHEVVVHNGGTTATAEFRASEYRPTNDFELAVQVDRAREVTAIPHVRGEDGYFMVLLAPPDETAGAWSRELVPEGDPLDLIVLADTSGSMDDGARANQAAFLDALLAQLGAKDRFQLAAFDAGVTWLIGAPTEPSDEAVAGALAELEARRSLGWTDLDVAMKEALARAGERTTIVVLGDGVGTTGDADPIALAERLGVLGRTTQATVHAVATSSSYEAPVLTALAGIGGGSVRTIGSRPAHSAFDLLAEAARPAVKDLQVTIEGLRTARVYPEHLPNLPLGAQQVVLGRFLPTGAAQTGRVVVTGTLAGKPVRYAADLSIAAGDEGNSFLPRLWGRRHLDALLAQGASAQVNEEIVAFSERFGIMTPLTSFLVLESDEDREQYGVERRVSIRDGERFFADARDRATLEQKRDLMRAAGRWRTDLRRGALLEIARLGRDLPINAPVPDTSSYEVAAGEIVSGISGFGFTSFGQTVFADKDGDTFFTDRIPAFVDRGINLDAVMQTHDDRTLAFARGGGGAWGSEVEEELDEAQNGLEATSGGRLRGRLGAREMAREMQDGGPPPAASPMPTSAAKAPAQDEKRKLEAEPAESSDNGDLDDMLEEIDKEAPLARRQARKRSRSGGARGYADVGVDFRGLGGQRPGTLVNLEDVTRDFTLQSLGFPWVPPAPPADEGAGAEEPWSEEVLAVLRTLPRRDDLRAVEGALHFVIRTAALHPTRGAAHGEEMLEAWVGGASWRLRRESSGFDEPSEAWVHEGVRGALATARRLARTRKAEPTDGNAWWLPIWDLRVRDVLRAWRRQGYRATLTSLSEAEAVVELSRGAAPSGSVRLRIDLPKRAIREVRWVDAQGKTRARIVHDDLFEVAGRWWARTIERFDEQDRLLSRRTLEIERVAPGALAGVFAAAGASRTDVLTVEGTLPTRVEAKQSVAERTGRFVDHLVLALDFGQQQRPQESRAAWGAAEVLAAGKPGAAWVRTVLLSRARRGEDFKSWVQARVAELQGARGPAGRFLVNWLFGLGAGTFGPRERLATLQQIEAVWVDAAAPLADRRRLALERLRTQALDQAGEPEEARALRARLADAWPYEVDLQLAFEQDLWAAGRFGEAIEALASWIPKREPWLEGERGQLYDRLVDRLWDRRELARLEATLEAWCTTSPRSVDPWWRRLSVHYLRGHAEAGDAAVSAQLAARLDDSHDDAAWARLEAAVRVALGNGWQFDFQRVEPVWHEALKGQVLHLFRLDVQRGTPVWSIFGHWRFRQLDTWREVSEALRADVARDEAVATGPLSILARYVQWLPWQRNQADEAVWRTFVDRVQARWSATEDEADALALGGHVLQLLDARGEREEALRFARVRWQRALERKRPTRQSLADQLLARLLATPNRDEQATPEREAECLALLPHLVDDAAPLEDRRAAYARQVRRIADRMYTWRYEAGLGTPEERSALTRAALQTLHKEVRARVRGELATRLGEAEATAPALAKPWLALERLGYAVEHGEALDGLVDQAAAILAGPWERGDNPLDRLVRERAAVILAYAATRGNVEPALAERVVALFRAGQAAEDAARAADAEAKPLLDWRYEIWRLLVARDDVPALERELDTWIAPAKVDSRWRIARGYLHAETGDVAAAARQFEAVQALDELAASDYAVMAQWYLVLGDDARRSQALDARLEHMNENELSNLLWQFEANVRNRSDGVPADFDPESVRTLRALMRKARHPGNHVHRLNNMYRGTKDFRILAVLSDGLVGHTPEASYALLGRIGGLIGDVHEEATLDALRDTLAEVQTKASTSLDRRVLHLAIALVEGRASLVPATDPSHGARALAALRAAFPSEWQPGEPRLMAGFLRSVGRIQDPAVRAEQLRQVEALRAMSEEGSLTRLHIADDLAELHWIQGAQDQALAVISAALDETRRHHGGRVPMDGVRVFDRHVNWLAEQKRFVDAERILLRESERWDLPERIRGLRGRLFKLYVDALQFGGSVSLGRGVSLFEGARALIEEAIATEPAYAQELLSTYGDLHRRAQERRMPADAGARLERWGRASLPGVLERVPLSATRYAGIVAGAVRDLRGPTAAVGFLLDRQAAEPAWLARIGYDTWNQHAYSFARWRSEAGDIGDLEPRLAALVVAQIEHNLIDGDGGASWFWNRNNKWSWPEKFPLFADTAGRIAELHEGSPVVLVRCAHFLRGSLGRGREGRDILAAAHARGQLDESARWTLCDWLTVDKALGPALTLVEALIQERPDNLRYRIQHVVVLAGLGRAPAARASIEGTAKRFEERKLWNEGVAATLGATAAKHGLADLAETWLEDAIRRRQEATGHRGGRDSTLCRYYRELAVARGALGKTKEAVQAASTAILSANPRDRGEFGKAQEALLTALRSAPDLSAYIATYDAEVEASGLDAPVLRKAFAQVFTERKAFALAVTQLELARDLDPGDGEIHKRLVASHDALGNAAGAIEALFGSICLAPQAVDAYPDLADRYHQAGDDVAAERALTTLAEMSPNQAAGHLKLAAVRGQQGRHAEALVQWQQVVRTERLDPTGWLALARAQIQVADAAGARKTLEHVLAGSWEPRFGDVKKTAGTLLQQLEH